MIKEVLFVTAIKIFSAQTNGYLQGVSFLALVFYLDNNHDSNALYVAISLAFL